MEKIHYLSQANEIVKLWPVYQLKKTSPTELNIERPAHKSILLM